MATVRGRPVADQQRMEPAMPLRHIGTLVVVVAVLGCGPEGDILLPDSPPAPSAHVTDHGVTLDIATAIALDLVPGEAVGYEREIAWGRDIILVLIRTPDGAVGVEVDARTGRTMDVDPQEVDPNTGEILPDDEEDAGTEGRSAANRGDDPLELNSLE